MRSFIVESLAAAVPVPAGTATPSPTPTIPPGPPAEMVTPGFGGFAVIALLVAAVVVLVWDMQRRVRRARYRGEVAAQLDDEQREAAHLQARADSFLTDATPDESTNPDPPDALGDADGDRPQP